MSYQPEFTPDQLAKLDDPLHPDDVEYRQGLAYLTGAYVKEELNRVFGYDGWTQTISSLEFTPLHEVKRGDKEGHTVAATCQLVLTIYTATHPISTEDVGYGNDVGYGATSAVSVYELAGKEAVTDALKRCASRLGDRFGLGLYSEAGRQDVLRRAKNLEDYSVLREKAVTLTAKTSVEEVAEELGIKTRDVLSRASLERALAEHAVSKK